MKINRIIIAIALLITELGFSAKADCKPAGQKIVSLNGTISEILAGIGQEANVIGTDITSNYPESMKRKPKVGHNRTITAEGIIALQPDIVTGLNSEVKPELRAQLKGAGIILVLFNQEYTADGTRKLIKEVAAAFGVHAKATTLINKLNADLAAAAKLGKTGAKPKVLFIYARGTGTMTVGGEGTSVEQIIELAGGQNAVKGFTDYKPLTPEALVAADPDAILLFSSGMESLGGVAGLQQVQGVNQTKAGKNKKFITMEGELLTGFGPRLGQAVSQLSQKLR